MDEIQLRKLFYPFSTPIHYPKKRVQLKQEEIELYKEIEQISKSIDEQAVNNLKTQKLPKLAKKTKKRWSISSVQSEQKIMCDEVTLKLEPTKISQITQKRMGNSDLHSVATGNWGCGKSLRGDVQLKLVIQWMAASVAGLPVLIYYTAGHDKLSKLDTICRVLLDRQWTVGELASATLLHAKEVLADPYDKSCECFFEQLIGLA